MFAFAELNKMVSRMPLKIQSSKPNPINNKWGESKK